MSAREVVREYWIVAAPGTKTTKECRRWLWKGDSYFAAVERIATFRSTTVRPRKVTVYRKVKPTRVPVGYVNVYGVDTLFVNGAVHGSVEDARTGARSLNPSVVMALHHVD